MKPRFISPQRTTTLLVEGYGLAHTSDDSKQLIAYKHYLVNKELTMGGKPITKVYKVLNENQVEVKTYPQSYLDIGGINIGFDPFIVIIMSPNGEFDPNECSFTTMLSQP